MRRYAGFYADELAIYSDADEDRLLEVLSALGIEDEFPGIREEAYDKYRADEPYEMPDWVKAVENRPPSAEGWPRMRSKCAKRCTVWQAEGQPGVT